MYIICFLLGLKFIHFHFTRRKHWLTRWYVVITLVPLTSLPAQSHAPCIPIIGFLVFFQTDWPFTFAVKSVQFPTSLRSSLKHHMHSGTLVLPIPNLCFFYFCNRFYNKHTFFHLFCVLCLDNVIFSRSKLVRWFTDPLLVSTIDLGT